MLRPELTISRLSTLVQQVSFSQDDSSRNFEFDKEKRGLILIRCFRGQLNDDTHL